MIVALDQKVYVFSLIDDLTMIFSTNTLLNPKGVMAVNGSDYVTVLCCPAEVQNKKSLGIVQVWNLHDIKDDCLTIEAHSSTIGTLELSHDGSLLATASEKGTIIRVFETKQGIIMQELRRGSETAVIFSINFHFQNEWLACISDSGTLHVYSLLGRSIRPKNVGGHIRKEKKKMSLSSKNPKSMYVMILTSTGLILCVSSLRTLTWSLVSLTSRTALIH